MTDHEIVEYLARHFNVINGPNVMRSQYGQLQLWWGAVDVHDDGDPVRNPHLMMVAASSSYSLVPMGELRTLIEAARANCATRGTEP